jgi:hypothetical protein
MAEFLVVAVADRPWSAIAAITDGTCEAHLIEDVPRAHRVEKGVPIKTEHFQ